MPLGVRVGVSVGLGDSLTVGEIVGVAVFTGLAVDLLVSVGVDDLFRFAAVGLTFGTHAAQSNEHSTTTNIFKAAFLDTPRSLPERNPFHRH